MSMGGVITLKTWKGSVIAPSMGPRAWPTASEAATSVLAALVDKVMTAKTAVTNATYAKLEDELREAKLCTPLPRCVPSLRQRSKPLKL